MTINYMKDDPLFWIYNTPKEDIKSIITSIDSILSGLKFEFTCLSLLSKYDLIDTIDSRKIKNFKLKKKRLGEDIYSFFLSKRKRGSGEIRNSRFIIFKHPTPNVYIVLTHENYTVFRDDIMSFFNRYYPKIAKIFIDSKYMEKILQNLERNLNGVRIRITKIFSQTRIISKDAEKKIESDLKWTDISYKEMFKRAEESDEWIKSIYFTLINTENLSYRIKKKHIAFKCQISRDGFFKCNKNLTIFYETVIKDIIYKAKKDLDIFDNRERIIEEKLKTKPIIIEYKINIFKDKDQNQHLIEVLQKITNTGLSVVHSNPYLHCSIIDFGDGSSYDIWILSHNQIIIVPQMRSSYASLERLCNHIFIGFREGIIKDYNV